MVISYFSLWCSLVKWKETWSGKTFCGIRPSLHISFFLHPQVPPLFPFSVCPVSCLLSIHPLCTVYHFGSYYSFQEGRCIQLPKWDSLLLIKYFLSKLLPHPLHFLFFIPFLSFFFLPYRSFTHLLVFHLLAFSLGFVFHFMAWYTRKKTNTFFNMCLQFKTVPWHLWGSFPWINCSWHKHSEWLKRHMAEQI